MLNLLFFLFMSALTTTRFDDSQRAELRSKMKQFQGRGRFSGYQFKRSTVDDLPEVMRIGYLYFSDIMVIIPILDFVFLFPSDADEHKEFIFSETEMSNLGQLLSSSKTEEEEAQKEVRHSKRKSDLCSFN